MPKQVPRQLYQQLLTALYQCSTSTVQEELPVLVDLLESAGDRLTHDGAELSVAVCRAFGIACPVSTCRLPDVPFLLLLQGVGLHDCGESPITNERSACMLLDVVNSAILMLYAFIVIMLLLLGVLKDRYAMGVFAEAKAG